MRSKIAFFDLISIDFCHLLKTDIAHPSSLSSPLLNSFGVTPSTSSKQISLAVSVVSKAEIPLPYECGLAKARIAFS